MLKEEEKPRCSPGIQCLWDKILSSGTEFFLSESPIGVPVDAGLGEPQCGAV